jgi:hypothetical protein
MEGLEFAARPVLESVLVRSACKEAWAYEVRTRGRNPTALLSPKNQLSLSHAVLNIPADYRFLSIAAGRPVIRSLRAKFVGGRAGRACGRADKSVCAT